MNVGWEKKKLDELFDVGSSKRVLQSQWKNEGVPLLLAASKATVSVVRL